MFPVLPVTSVSGLIETADVVSGSVGRVLVSLSGDQIKDTLPIVRSVSEKFVDISVLLTGDASTDELISLLDAGVEYLVVSEPVVADLIESGVPGSRLVINISEKAGEFLESIASDSSQLDSNLNIGFYIGSFGISKHQSLVAAGQAIAKTVLATTGGARFLLVSDPSFVSSSNAIAPAIPVVEAHYLSTETTGNGTLSIASFITNRLVSDRVDGLYTTLVVDAYDNSLGLVYSSEESISEAVRTGKGVYQSRKRGLWYKGQTSGAEQTLLRIDVDCDGDCVKFVVDQTAPGFCHNNTSTCFGQYSGISALEQTLISRKKNAPEGSYTARLFNDSKLLTAKIMEEAEELCDAKTANEISWEAADLIYFAMTKLVQEGVSWNSVQRNLDLKSRKISRRKGDAKRKWQAKLEEKEQDANKSRDDARQDKKPKNADQTSSTVTTNGTEQPQIKMNVVTVTPETSETEIAKVLTRPLQKSADIMKLVTPIINNVRDNGDKALIELTEKFDRVKLQSPVLYAPFPENLMQISEEVKAAIDLSISNIEKFHAAQINKDEVLHVETAPGVICSRFSRAIESVGLYVPGGTAVLPSTAMMLGIPAKVAGCKNIILASPPRSDGTLTPEVVYVAHKVGAKAILLAGGAQAVAALAYGTESVPKVDKIMGPGNQFVTAAKMFVQNDTSAQVSIDMPAGPSEVLVIADGTSNPAFVASDLLSQAEHGVDSQVILIAISMTDDQLAAVETEVHEQAMRLPRVDIVRGSIAHSTTIRVDSIERAMQLSNQYGPEHLILQVHEASRLLPLVEHAGSVFVGAWSPESCGDYSSGTNHTLPTYGYAKMYSGVNTDTFMKHITSQELTEQGLKNIGPAVMALAATEGLDGHRNAVKVRLESLGAL
ncbi:trifunctional histidinol dehydrogenase/phosphoribosyl-AMP cyclohydrolase/phosphoribosyl-ATP diphosphatase [Sugiyamaella lignohabitans]|uniref:Histidine biosynthesis trifunctional protein n=1 Tax=Sugiyamaella lignohabitans TaxID=796027 RepID=A0A167F801_9ASCO|nr:trifunctional histidinol dehydrogenase/phosphoribosyl-AMP cyclohydrolase/phosphoribosyl-ATP diphosphatase [Sugiyamaella lignohabitans]ANB14932.1 trifunctional histidinol dehydrogenase/phosphoribosyl-AMP cyclohydrolase/phosphoribosyl-ATP diphosphatase [Sugiyamaella lignohabitans]